MSVGLMPALADSAVLKLECRLQNQRVCVGEPIVLEYKLTNLTESMVGVYISDDNHEWFRLEPNSMLREGYPPPALVNRIAEQASEPKYRILRSKGTFSGEIVFNWSQTQGSEGRQFVNAAVNLRYTTKDSMQDMQRLVSVTFPDDEILAQRVSLPLTVTMVNPAHLRSLAEKLRESALTQREYYERHTTILALFAIPEAQGLDSWRKLALDSRFGDGVFFDTQLRQIGSPASSKLYKEIQAERRARQMREINDRINRSR